jgi:hypothetical protein
MMVIKKTFCPIKAETGKQTAKKALFEAVFLKSLQNIPSAHPNNAGLHLICWI